MSRPRIIAFYLPQFYPTPENDEWWGKGFTEWTNVGNAKPLFKGHYQPKVPADLGYYDLRLPIVREQQAQMAREAGVEGFCYWHYWTNGRRMLSDVFKEVLRDKKPDFPFCLCWANHSWYKKGWSTLKKDELLVEQVYPGEDDYKAHFYAMLDAFKDPRYMKINGKLIFGIFRPYEIPNTREFFSLWNRLAQENGLEGFHFFGYSHQGSRNKEYLDLGFDSLAFNPDFEAVFKKGLIARALHKIKREYLRLPQLIFYKDYVEECKKCFTADPKIYPCIEPNFDHSPRSGTHGLILHDSTPALWEELCQNTFKCREAIPHEENLVFIKAWNEWGEGNYLEPDLRFGKQYLYGLKKEIEACPE